MRFVMRRICALLSSCTDVFGGFSSVSFAPCGACSFLWVDLTHGLRRGLHSCAPSELLLSRLLEACALEPRWFCLGLASVARRCGPVLLGRPDGSKTRPHTSGRGVRSAMLQWRALRLQRLWWPLWRELWALPWRTRLGWRRAGRRRCAGSFPAPRGGGVPWRIVRRLVRAAAWRSRESL